MFLITVSLVKFFNASNFYINGLFNLYLSCNYLYYFIKVLSRLVKSEKAVGQSKIPTDCISDSYEVMLDTP